ncbi:hypothetical protein [Terribacillus saccharophilus]
MNKTLANWMGLGFVALITAALIYGAYFDEINGFVSDINTYVDQSS